MKKAYLSLASFIACLGLNAQLTQSNHAPANGDTYEMFHCDSVNINPGPAGASMMWNFAASTTYSNLVTSYTAMSVGTSTYPLANIAVASAANNIGYYASSPGGIHYYGGNIAIGTVVGSLTYTSSAVSAVYPMGLNTTSSSVTNGTIGVTQPFPTNGTFVGNSKTIADGTGTVTMPGGGVFPDVIRVVSSQTINITTPIATATVFQMNYDYYSNGTKAPIFSIMTATANTAAGPTTQTVVLRNKNAVPPPPVGIQQLAATNGNFVVYPNPSSTHVNFATDNVNAKQVSVYEVTGKLIEKQNLNEGKLKLDVSAYNKGLYFYTVSDASGQKIKSGRFTVSQ